MATERVVETPTHDSLKRIDDMRVQKELVQRLEMMFVQEDVAAYDHDTGHAKSPIITHISRELAAAHSPNDSSEVIWENTKQRYGRAIEQMLDALGEGTSVSSDTAELHGCLARYVCGAAAMEAIDAASGATPDGPMSFDALLENNKLASTLAANSAQGILRQTGLVARDPDTGAVVEVAGLLDDRKLELRKEGLERATELLNGLMDEQSVSISTEHAVMTRCYELTARAGGERRLELDYFTRYLENILSHEYAVKYLGYILETLPLRYIQQLQRGEPAEIVQKIDELIEASLASSIKLYDGAKPQTLQGLNRYWPGGIGGKKARSDERIQHTAKFAYGSYDKMMIAAMPSDIYMNTNHPYDVYLDHNATTLSLTTEIIEELLIDDPDSDYALEYTNRSMRSMSSRKLDASGRYQLASEYSRNLRNLSRLIYRAGGPEKFKKLDEAFDLAAYDMYTGADIDTLTALLDGDEAMLKQIREKDVNLILYDAYGSTNEAMYADVSNLATDFDDTRARVLVPWNRPSALYRILALLKKRDVQPCTITCSAHGTPSKMFFGDSESDEFVVASEPTAGTTPDVDPARDRGEIAYISHSQIKRIVSSYMQLPRHSQEHSLPDAKRIVISACYSDVGDITRASLAEAALVYGSNEKPDLATIGASNISYTQRNGGFGLTMAGPQREAEYDEARDPNTYSSNMVLLTIPDPDAEWTRTDKRVTRITIEGPIKP